MGNELLPRAFVVASAFINVHFVKLRRKSVLTCLLATRLI